MKTVFIFTIENKKHMNEVNLKLNSLSFFAVFLLVMACLFGCSDTEPIMNEPINTGPIGTGTDSTKRILIQKDQTL